MWESEAAVLKEMGGCGSIEKAKDILVQMGIRLHAEVVPRYSSESLTSIEPYQKLVQQEIRTLKVDLARRWMKATGEKIEVCVDWNIFLGSPDTFLAQRSWHSSVPRAARKGTVRIDVRAVISHSERAVSLGGCALRAHGSGSSTTAEGRLMSTSP